MKQKNNNLDFLPRKKRSLIGQMIVDFAVPLISVLAALIFAIFIVLFKSWIEEPTTAEELKSLGIENCAQVAIYGFCLMQTKYGTAFTEKTAKEYFQVYEDFYVYPSFAPSTGTLDADWFLSDYLDIGEFEVSERFNPFSAETQIKSPVLLRDYQQTLTLSFVFLCKKVLDSKGLELPRCLSLKYEF